MEMEFIYFIVLLISSVSAIPPQHHLEIIEKIDGCEYPVSGQLTRQIGTNLTLVCKLSTTDDYDYEFAWGKKLNDNFYSKKELRLFIKSYEPIQYFRSLLLHDSGTYFCTNFKYNLFKFVDLTVTHSQFTHANNKFKCKSKTSCIDYKFVCDDVKDCDDGSDEDVDICGYNCCIGKHRCLNGRCISESLCKDNFPTCCEDDDYDWIHLHKFDFSNGFSNDHEWHTGENDAVSFNSIWIAVPCIIILLIIISCVILRIYFIKTNRRSVINQNADKPPSYNEAVANNLPSAPPCETI